MGISIRRALPQDIPDLIVELKEFSDFFQSKYPLFGSDEAYNYNILTSLINNHLFFVAVKGDELIGFIAGLVMPHLFNPTIKTLQELFWWVKTAHRNSSAGSRLLKAYLDYGKEHCQWVIMTLEENSPVKKESILSRGFKLKETAFIMEM